MKSVSSVQSVVAFDYEYEHEHDGASGKKGGPRAWELRRGLGWVKV